MAGADEIEIKTSDKRSFQATVVGTDSLSDVAVLKIKESVQDLPVAYLGNSDELRRENGHLQSATLSAYLPL